MFVIVKTKFHEVTQHLINELDYYSGDVSPLPGMMIPSWTSCEDKATFFHAKEEALGVLGDLIGAGHIVGVIEAL